MIFGDNPDADNPVPDLFAIKQSANLYLYTLNSPIMFTDPSGLLLVSQYPAFALEVTRAALAAGVRSALNIVTFAPQLAYTMGNSLGLMITGQVSVQDVMNAAGGRLWDSLSGNIRFLISNYTWFSPNVELTDAQIRELAERTVGAMLEVANAALMIKGVVNAAKTISSGNLKFTNHGLDQVMGRDGGRGVSDAAIRNTLNSPTTVTHQSNGAIRFEGAQSVVVLNQKGEIITAWARSSQYYR